MTKKWSVILLLILFVSQGIMIGAAADKVPKKAIKLVNKATESLKKNDIEKAVEAYNKAIELAPEYALAYYGLGRLYASQKKFDEAEKNLEKAIENDPTQIEAKQLYSKVLYQLGRNAISQRKLDESNSYFIKLTEIEDIENINVLLYKDTLFQIGTNYKIARKNDKSNEYYIKLSELPVGNDPSEIKFNVQSLFQIGANFYDMKKHKEAIQYFEKLLLIPNIDSDFHMLYISATYMVGLISSLIEDHDKSIKYLSNFLEIAADSKDHSQFFSSANYLLGLSHMALLQKEISEIKEVKGKTKIKQISELAKKYGSIATYLSKAMELKPGLEPALMNLGIYYYYCENIEKAIEIYKQLIEKYPNSPDINQYTKFLKDIEKNQKTKK